MRLIRPKISIYIPHDLLSPYGDGNLNEFRYLDLYDFVLAPTDSLPLQAALGGHTRIIDAGWIKHAGLQLDRPRAVESGDSRPKASLFVTMVEHLRSRFGPAGVARYFAPLLTPGVRVKLPAWHGVAEIESAMREAGRAEVIPAQESSVELILDSDVVICNGASSIHAEAALLGRPAICLLDDEGLSPDQQRSKLQHLRNIYFHDYRRRQPIADEQLRTIAASNAGQHAAQPFDYGLVERIIETAYPAHAADRATREAVRGAASSTMA
jgi:hypothetical protein